MPPLPIRPPVLCAGCPHRGSFFAVKEAMKGRPATYSGDIGCYTLGNAMPLDMVDTCLCMGAGITQAQGIAIASSIRSAAKAPVTNPDLESASDPATNFAFIGDSTFLHTGIPGLINAAWNGTDVVLCILDNSTTAMTGGQPHPGMGMRLNGESSKKIDLYEIAKAAGADSVCRVNAFDLDACKNAAANAADGKGVRVIIFEGPCINIVPKGDPLAVTEKDCTGCSLCVTKLGCPALSMREDAAAGNKTGKLASIDPVLCTGCGLCAKVCPFGAIGKE